MVIQKYQQKGIEFISIKNNNRFEVILSSLGASIYGIKLDEQYLTMTLKNIDDFKIINNYHGKTIGRVANRMKNASFIINEKTYHVDQNEGHNCLHSGKDGLSTKIFSYVTNEKDEYDEIIFTYVSPSLEGGFPGEVIIIVHYLIYKNTNRIDLLFGAQSSEDTLFSLTNHTYFTLGSSSLDDLMLTIKANKFVHPSPLDLLPIEVRDVDQIMDFQLPKCITKDIENDYLINSKTFGYDHHYCFNEVNPEIPQVSLENNEYRMDIFTDFSGVQIYTDNYPDQYEWFNTTLSRRRGIAIEPEEPYLERKILKKNEQYHHFISYRFYVKNN